MAKVPGRWPVVLKIVVALGSARVGNIHGEAMICERGPLSRPVMWDVRDRAGVDLPEQRPCIFKYMGLLLPCLSP